MHWRDLLKDENNGVSWCPANHDPVYEKGFPQSPCMWHHTVAMMNFAQCMLHKGNFTFFLDTGGLIGSLRNGGMELSDYDLDFGVWLHDNDERKKLEDMAAESKKLLQEAFSLQNRTDVDFRIHYYGGQSTAHFTSLIDNKGITHIDTFWVNSTSHNTSLAHRPNKKGKEHVWDVADLFPIRQCNFMGQIVPCPHRPYAHLKKWGSLKRDNIFLPMGNTIYHRRESLKNKFLSSSNRTMNCQEKFGFPTLRSQNPPFKPYFT